MYKGRFLITPYYLYLPTTIFTHEQHYVIFNRIKAPNDVWISIKEINEHGKRETRIFKIFCTQAFIE